MELNSCKKEYSCSRSIFVANVASSYDQIITLKHELSDSNKESQKSQVFIQNLFECSQSNANSGASFIFLIRLIKCAKPRAIIKA